MSKTPWRRSDLIYINRRNGNGYGNGGGGGGGGGGGTGIAVIGKYPTIVYGLYNNTVYGDFFFDCTAANTGKRFYVVGANALPCYDAATLGAGYHEYLCLKHVRNIPLSSNAASLFSEKSLDGYVYYIPKGTSLQNTAYRICDSNGQKILVSSQQFSISQNGKTCYMFKYDNASAQSLVDIDNALHNGLYDEGVYYIVRNDNLSDDELIKRFNAWKFGYTQTLKYYEVNEIQNFLI